MSNKKRSISVKEMEFIASIRGKSISDFKPRTFNKTYRLRISDEEYKKLEKFREQEAHYLDTLLSSDKKPRILIFDIETAPMKAYVWSKWKQDIGSNQFMSDWYVLSWSAKWLNNNYVMSDVLSPEEALKENDSRIVKSLWNLFDQSNIIIAHNAQKFDVPKMNVRFVINGLTPPSPYRIIDTLCVARKQFKFTSNRLDDLAGYFGIEHKIETSFELWDRCVNGDQEALNYMEEYNIRDVEILEKVYLKLRPWIKNHPNLSLYLENKEETCPYCGSTNLFDTGTFTYTNVSKFSNVKCSDCHAISRRRTSDYPKEKRKNLITST